MGNFASDTGLDEALNWYADCDEMHVCSAEPADYADVANVTLGVVAMVGGDFTLSDGDVDGRKVTVAAKTVTPSASGTTNHVALVKTGDTTLRRVTTSPAEAVVISVQKNISSWAFTIRDVP